MCNNKLIEVKILFQEKKYQFNILIYGNMILAILLGVYGQGILYYIIDNIALMLPPLYCLAILTMTSILLFLVPPILIYKYNKKHKIGDNRFALYIAINTLAGVITSVFSLIILIMWWG